ncbi:hypothetical protein MKX03_035995 [Papaver bracteatum]|nr:hypothetical protein MKX03_035995 [Papaver bracteatum]
MCAAYAHEFPRYGLEVGLTNYAECKNFMTLFMGSLDGGLDIPHSYKRFDGFKKGEEKKDAALDPEIHRKYIFGGHVGTYMRSLMEDEPEKFQTHFSEYAKRNIDTDGLEALYNKVHAAICADPTVKKTEKAAPDAHKRYNLKKLTYDEVLWRVLRTPSFWHINLLLFLM